MCLVADNVSRSYQALFHFCVPGLLRLKQVPVLATLDMVIHDDLVLSLPSLPRMARTLIVRVKRTISVQLQLQLVLVYNRTLTRLARTLIACGNVCHGRLRSQQSDFLLSLRLFPRCLKTSFIYQKCCAHSVLF